MSGFRCGVLYSLNEEVLSAVGATAYFQCVPTTTQVIRTFIPRSGGE